MIAELTVELAAVSVEQLLPDRSNSGTALTGVLLRC
jgi:hypothetical protein